MTGLALYCLGHESTNRDLITHHKMFSDIQSFLFLSSLSLDCLKYTFSPTGVQVSLEPGNSKSYPMLSSMPSAPPWPYPPSTMIRLQVPMSDRPLFSWVPFLFYCCYLPPPHASSLILFAGLKFRVSFTSSLPCFSREMCCSWCYWLYTFFTISQEWWIKFTPQLWPN